MVNDLAGSRKIKSAWTWYKWEATHSDPQNPGKSQEIEQQPLWKQAGNILYKEHWALQVPTSIIRLNALPPLIKYWTRELQIGTPSTEEGEMWCLTEKGRVKFYMHNNQWHSGALCFPRCSMLKANVTPSRQEVERSSFWELFQNKNLQKLTSGWKNLLTILMISHRL